MINPFLFGAPGVGDTSSAREAASASSAASRASRNAAAAEDRIERLTLVCMAMWSLIQDKTDLTEDDLLQRVEDIDVLDGRADGKASRGVQKCGSCDRTLNNRHRKCLYCGTQVSGGTAFDTV